VTIIDKTWNKSSHKGKTGSISSSSLRAALDDIFLSLVDELTPEEAAASVANVDALLGMRSVNGFEASYTVLRQERVHLLLQVQIAGQRAPVRQRKQAFS
jgi:hypothetical protein